MVHQIFFALGLVAMLAATGQRGTVPVSPPGGAESQLDRQVSNGDLAAIQEVERSGDSRYVSSLIAYIARAMDPSVAPAPAATVAAARNALTALVTTAQMQSIVCQAMRDDALMPVSDRFRIIGGWYGIRSLQMLLTPEAEQRWGKAVAKADIPNDISYSSPKLFALMYLQDLVPSPPIRLNLGAAAPAEWESAAKIWLAWIPAHRSELELLKPTGEGVVFTAQACRAIRR